MALYVITGRSSSGKSALIDELAKRGCDIVDETASKILAERKDHPITYDEIKLRQELMHKIQQEKETCAINRITNFMNTSIDNSITYSVTDSINTSINVPMNSSNHSSSKNIFLDRSLLEYKIFTEHYLGSAQKFMTDIDYTNKYAKIFSLEALDFKSINRVEKDSTEADNIFKKIVDEYKKYDFQIINVPIFSNDMRENIDKRTDFILKNIS